jgi:DNA-3-methyladenine glycosylase
MPISVRRTPALPTQRPPANPAELPTLPNSFHRLPRSFFNRNTAQVARDLLGQWIVHRTDGIHRIGRIVETEAYLGPHDRASHSSRGRTSRNQSMFGPPGHAYVYLIYGLHHCLNVVTEPEGHGSAVLLRALEPVHHLPGNTRGPGLLCRALSIDRSLDGTDLLGDTLFLSEPTLSSSPFKVVRSQRIGVDYAGPWSRRLLRFHIRNNPWVSRR